jgi:hypothetical protein
LVFSVGREGKVEARFIVAGKLSRGAGRDIARSVDEVKALNYEGKRK